jgi:DNA polymerase III subunit epsilon
MRTPRADLGSTPIAVIDTETTGVYPGGHDRIIEIAVIRYQPGTGEIEDEYVTLVNPKRDVGRTDIHGIAAGDLLQAPEFREVAGDIGHRLNGAILAAHNVRFDLGFLHSEYARVGIELPQFPALCTLHLAYRFHTTPSRKLGVCCAEAGVDHHDDHTAAGDARACLDLLSHYLRRAGRCRLGDLGCDCDELPDPGWIRIMPTGRALPRSEVAVLRARELGYLSRLVEHLPGSEGSSVREAEYLCLLDRVLEDRALTREEAHSLCAAARSWGMSQHDVSGAHQAYLWALVRQAKADGVVTDLELRDLARVAELLGIDAETLVRLLDTLTPADHSAQQASASANALAGKSICFTGELLGMIAGQRVTREMAENLACKAGMLVKPGVSKSLDILVVADPDTQSGKARKAREYGTRIMAEATFWQAVGLRVD